MNKRLLTLFLMLTAATVSTLAENYGIYIAGTQVTSSNCNDLTVLDKVQPYSASVNSGKAYAKYDANSKTLTLCSGGYCQGQGLECEEI